MTNNAVNLTATNGSHLSATLTAQASTGMVTLKSGQSFAFTASAITPGQGYAGLYRSEQTFNGVLYLAGWVGLAYTPPTAMVAPAQMVLLAAWTPLRECYPLWCMGGAIINEQTGAVFTSPLLKEQDAAALRATVPGLGTFVMDLCRLAQCG